MRWTPWMARSWTEGSYGSRWPGTADPPILTTVVEVGEEGRPGGMVVMDAEAEALPAARDKGDAADPAAGAALVPEADPATADPGPAPTADPSPSLPGTRRPSPNRDLDPGVSPSLSLNPSPGAAPLPPKEGPGRYLKARPRRQQKMEAHPRRAQHVSNSFQVKTSEHQVPDWIIRKQQCPAVQGYYCVFHASVCFLHLATKRAFSFYCCALILFVLHDMFMIFNNLALRGEGFLICFCNDYPR